jgi:chorismate mutase/prephenate dehydratase
MNSFVEFLSATLPLFFFMEQVELDKLRRQINEYDDKLLDILNERMNVVREVGKLKQANKSAIYRPEREKEIIDRLCKRSNGLLKRSAIEAIFLEIFAISRNLELPEMIAYLGPEGSFTHQAAESRFGAMSEYIALESIRSVFEAVETERARFGVVPLENNQEGIVSETIDLLGKTSLQITAEIPLPIHFAFATKCEHLRDVKKIYSRDIGFLQCRKFIDDSFADHKVELIPVNSTSKAVMIALEEPGSAAMCSHIAAKLYQLPILFDNVEDSSDNFTRFLIIGKDMKNQRSGTDKTSLLARTQDKPGSLMLLLQDFYEQGINITKLESRPAKRGKAFKYLFYLDIDGHLDDEPVSKVFDKHRNAIKWLGSYVKLC